MVAMTITLMILTLIASQVSLLGQRSPKIISSQERLEALFNTVDFFKSDMSSCGKLLIEAQNFLPPFCCETAPHKLTIRLGTAVETLSTPVMAQSKTLDIETSEYFAAGKEILIYDPVTKHSEWTYIENKSKSQLCLEACLKQDYSTGSRLIAIKTICYQHDPSQQILRRKVDQSPAQPMLEEVKDFYFSFFPQQASILYQLELSTGEQVRGYIAITNLIQP